MRRPEFLALMIALLSACSIVRHSHVRPDYDAADKQQTVRLIALAVPTPGDADRGRLVAKIAQRYTNHHRDFVVTTASTAATLPEDRCDDEMQGVLTLAATYEDAGDEVGISVEAKLVRCRDGEEVWAAGGSGAWPREDPQISQVIAQYESEIGEDVVPYVPATFHLLRALLDTLPYPELVDDDLVMEKIDLAD